MATAHKKEVVQAKGKQKPAQKAQTPPAATLKARVTPAKAKRPSPSKTLSKPVAKPAPASRPAPKGASPSQAGQPARNAARKDLNVNTVKKPLPSAVKAPASKTPAVKAPVAKPPAKHSAAQEPRRQRFSQTDLDHFRTELLAMRDRITGQSGSMRQDALQRSDEINPEEDGTDAFLRLQALGQVSSQQQTVATIDESLRAIEKGTYGACDMCGELISKQRLTVLPFAKNCIHCQSEMERASRPGGRR